jgi:hypothetical protein
MRLNRYLVGAIVAAVLLVGLHFLLPEPFEPRNETRDLDASQIQSVFTYDLPPLPEGATADACIQRIRPLPLDASGEEHVVACRLRAPPPQSLTTWAASLAAEQGAAPVTSIPLLFDLPEIGAPFAIAQAWTRVPLDNWDVNLPLVFTNADGTEGAVYLKVHLLQ